MYLRENPISSPLNYTGGKYKLLSQIFPLFPEHINTFVDIFCGGCNIGVNVQANRIICNDNNSKIIGLFNYLKNTTFNDFIDRLYEIIDQYHLSNTAINGYPFYNCNSYTGLGHYNREHFLELRENFNNLNENDTNYYAKLYILIVYAFNNQIRFNSEGNYNLPVGKRDLNQRMINKLHSFIDNIGNIDFTNFDFQDFNIANLGPNDFVYADPPYLITCASYNELNGWNEQLELSLLNKLDELNEHHVQFALSNVITSKGKRNTILEDWLNTHPDYTCHHLSYSYRNSNYHKIDKQNLADEVLITNY